MSYAESILWLNVHKIHVCQFFPPEIDIFFPLENMHDLLSGMEKVNTVSLFLLYWYFRLVNRAIEGEAGISWQSSTDIYTLPYVK